MLNELPVWCCTPVSQCHGMGVIYCTDRVITMYASVCIFIGGDSGKVHSTVKDRWAARDPLLVLGMQTLGGYADQARDCLLSGDIPGLASLMEQNFAMRRALYGDAVVGARNIDMVSVAKTYGLSAKFTGSGGALLCLRLDGQGW